ncbi:hypothetical protein [Streptomyces tropicalis]|uniref:Integral membrane protein n=1 Tax=Streptomyces tropicalis TaxID=3034234 RepID=A0ABT6A713_9ACTN|nr:hypothetical protein [Streptomyces tropicalis]MDF3300435.1 hypothetical protein [Streptomyces tropicalis]
MSWYQQTWWTDLVLPAVVCAGVAWFGLLRHFHGRGRLLGSRRSAALACTVLVLMCAVAVGTGQLLPHLAALPPAAAGFATGAAAIPRKKQDETTQPYVKFMTLGVAWLMERLEYRLRTDGLTWCDRLLEDVRESAQLRLFAHGVKHYLLERHQQNAVAKTVNAAYDATERAIDVALDVQTRTDEACRTRWPAPGRPTEHESFECRRTLEEARAHCAHLLLLAYQLGRRSEHPELEALRDKVVSDDAYRSGAVPVQRRWFTRRGTRR